MLATIVASLSATMFAGTPINQSELPKAAQTFITKYFSKDQVRKVEKDNGRRGMEYEVDFTSGAEVDFIFDGNFDHKERLVDDCNRYSDKRNKSVYTKLCFQGKLEEYGRL